jgi:hypothetical protein
MQKPARENLGHLFSRTTSGIMWAVECEEECSTMAIDTQYIPHTAFVVPTDPIWRLRVDQYHEMIRTGILTDDDPVELLECTRCTSVKE